MIIKHNKIKQKKYQKKLYKGQILPRVHKALEIELQYAEAAIEFQEYFEIPRSGSKRGHILNGDYKNYFGFGLDHIYRLVLDPGIDKMSSKEISIIEYAINYH